MSEWWREMDFLLKDRVKDVWPLGGTFLLFILWLLVTVQRITLIWASWYCLSSVSPKHTFSKREVYCMIVNMHLKYHILWIAPNTLRWLLGWEGCLKKQVCTSNMLIRHRDGSSRNCIWRAPWRFLNGSLLGKINKFMDMERTPCCKEFPPCEFCHINTYNFVKILFIMFWIQL